MAGMNDFLAKPPQPERFYDKLLYWLTRQSASGESPCFSCLTR